MGIGVGIFLIAIGAILTFAVHWHIAGLDLQAVGWVLMFAGLAGVTIAVSMRVVGLLLISALMIGPGRCDPVLRLLAPPGHRPDGEPTPDVSGTGHTTSVRADGFRASRL